MNASQSSSALPISEEHLAMQLRIAELELEVERMRNIAILRQTYSLATLPSGMLVREYQRGGDDATPPHYACVNCLEDGACSPLQPVRLCTLLRLVCQRCNAQLQ